MRNVRVRQALLNFVMLGLASIAGLALCEIALRLIVPASTGYRVLWPNRRTVFLPDSSLMYGVHGQARYTVNSEGIRGREWGQDTTEYRLLAIGGSTTECVYLDDSETWTAELESLLGRTANGSDVWVGSVGRSGRNARDHVVQVKYLTEQHPALDAALILVGVNDLTVALGQGDSYVAPPPLTDPEAEAQTIRRAFTMIPGKLHEPGTDQLLVPNAPWYKGTAVYQLLKRVKLRVRDWILYRGITQDVRGTVYEQWRAHRRNASNFRDELPDLTAALREYTRNLNAIVDQTEKRDVRLIYLTQPVLWREGLSNEARDRLWLGGIGDFLNQPGHEYYSVAALAEAMKLYNDALLGVCRDRNIECIDLAKSIPRDTSNFYDDAHFTEKGARLVAEHIAEYLRGTAPFRPVASH